MNSITPTILDADSNIVQPLEKIEPQKNSSVKVIQTKFSGRYSLQSYSNFNNIDNRGEYQRWRHSLRFGLQNIGGSGLSFSTYSIFHIEQINGKLFHQVLVKHLKYMT